MDDHDASMLRFEVLGPLRGRRGRSELSLGPMQQRVVLAVLLLQENHPISRESLIDAVWGEDVPRSAVNLVHRHVSGLRRSLLLDQAGAVQLAWTDAGYLLTVPPECLDLTVFQAELRRAREAGSQGDPVAAAAALRTASQLWRGDVCEGLSSQWLDAERDRLVEQHLDALETRIELELLNGDRGSAVPELRRLITANPLRERLRAVLMLALVRSGRQADALRAYQSARRYLREELGVEPGAGLQQLHQQILTADPALNGPPPVRAEAAISGPTLAGRTALAQLPHSMGDFVGREAELVRLHQLLRDQRGQVGAGVLITVIAGTAGVGKTSLAVTWAHQIRDQFPDGQLYVDLHGFDPTDSATDPAKAIRGFLDAFAVPPDRIPTDSEDQAMLYRSILAGRRMLIVLDNARNAAQVRPLLPGSSDCLVVVTSRDRLISLVAVDGAQTVLLGLLSGAEARQLMIRRLGPSRVAAESEAVGEIIASCARLPLALSVISARAAINPSFSLAAIAVEVSGAHGSLDAFDGGDPVTDVRAVFACSYDALTAAAARLFRLLSLHVGPDISSRAAASLAASEPSAARAALAELARTNLIVERIPSRYLLHDLLRAYACELAEKHDSPADRRAAVLRVLDHYLHTTNYAGDLLSRYRDDPIELPAPASGVRPERMVGLHQAQDWLAVEEPVLLAALRQASRQGFHRHTWQLAWALAHHLYRRGHWHDAAAAGRAALDAARILGDLRAEAISHGGTAYACIRLGRYDHADRHLKQAFKLYRRLGDHIGMGHTHRTTAWALDRQHRYEEALPHVHKALHLFGLAGHETGEARALNGIGWFHFRLGDAYQALTYCQQALDLQEKTGDRFDMGDTLDSLGQANHQLGHFPQAIDHYRRAVELYREFGDSYNEADTLGNLGDSYLALGDRAAAHDSWQRAVHILDRLGHPDAVLVRQKIVDPTETTPSASP